MPSRCCVPLCKGNYPTGPKVSIYSFPTDDVLRKQWIKLIQRKYFIPTKHSKALAVRVRARLRGSSPTATEEEELEPELAPPTLCEEEQLERELTPPTLCKDQEMVAEAKLLRQHKRRLEARMQILKDDNWQLEARLTHLRQLLEESEGQVRGSPQDNGYGVSQSSVSWNSHVIMNQVPRQNSQMGDHSDYICDQYFPAMPAGSARVGNLLHMAGNLGKAVRTLATVMTDDEDASASDEDLKH